MGRRPVPRHYGCRGLAAAPRSRPIWAAFSENAIAADVLPDLTDSDLEKLDVPLGDRKRLLKAIVSLGPAPTPSQPRGPPATAAPREDAAGRRHPPGFFC